MGADLSLGAQSTTEGGYGYKQSCDGYYQTFGDEVTSVASWCGYRKFVETQSVESFADIDRNGTPDPNQLVCYKSNAKCSHWMRD